MGGMTESDKLTQEGIAGVLTMLAEKIMTGRMVVTGMNSKTNFFQNTAHLELFMVEVPQVPEPEETKPEGATLQ